MYGTTAQPNQESVLEAIGPGLSAWTLAEKYADRWPQAKDAAEQAATYIDRCQVAQTTTGAGPEGDRWIVANERCSHTGKGQCTCHEAALVVDQFGRLCSHRIAVMMAKSIYKANAVRLVSLIKHFDANPGQGDNRRCVLYVDRYYITGAEDVKYLRYAGRGAQMLRVDLFDQCLLDNAGMIAAARLTGYTLEMAPQKKQSMRYNYVLTPVDPTNPPACDAEWFSQDANYHQQKEENRARERSLARQFDNDLRTNTAGTDSSQGKQPHG